MAAKTQDPESYWTLVYPVSQNPVGNLLFPVLFIATLHRPQPLTCHRCWSSSLVLLLPWLADFSLASLFPVTMVG